MRWSHRRKGGAADVAASEDDEPRARNRVSATVSVLLAIVLVAAGAGGAFLYIKARMPRSFVSSLQTETVTVEASTFDDSHMVTVTVPQSTHQSVVSPVTGTVTRLDCAVGGQVASGSACLSVDETPVLMLYMSVPPYRAIAPNATGRDVQALNSELRRLGYGAPDSSTMTWDTITAYNALAASVGSPQLTQDTGWTLDPSMFAWLPQESVTISSTALTYGGQAVQGQELFATSIPPTSVVFSRTLSAGSLAAGDRIVTIGGATYTIPDGQTTITDPAVVNAVLGSSEYAAALSSSDPTATSVQVSYTWKLAAPLAVTSVPPASLYDVEGSSGCVVSDGSPRAVSIVASQLGRTMVTVDDGGAISSVDVLPSSAKACR